MINKKIAECIGKENVKVLYSILSDLENKYTNVWLTTDWHLFIKDRDADVEPAPVKLRDNAADILHWYESLNENDLLIHLGDLNDDEFYSIYDNDKCYEIMNTLFKNIKCKKILLLGNNDPVEQIPLFERLGFDVYDGMVIEDLVLTHQPTDISWSSGLFNIHGHSHGHLYYWRVPFTHHLDIWRNDRKPIPLDRRVLNNLEMDYVPFVMDISHLHLKNKAEFTEFKGGSLKNKGNI